MSDQATPAAPDRWKTLGARALFVFQVISSVAIFVLMLHVLAHVFMRYVFNAPIQGTTEMVAYYYMPIVALLGFVLAKHAKEIIEAPLIFDNLTWGNRRILVVFSAGLAAIMTGLWTYFTFTEFALHGLKIRAVGGVSTIQVWPIFFLVPLVFLILCGMYVRDIVRAARGQIDEHRDEDEAAFGTVQPLEPQHDEPAADAAGVAPKPEASR